MIDTTKVTIKLEGWEMAHQVRASCAAVNMRTHTYTTSTHIKAWYGYACLDSNLSMRQVEPGSSLASLG